MCHAADSAPPIKRGPVTVASDELVLASSDGARFSAFAARPQRPTGVGVVVLPDLRGLHGFYRNLAVRLAEHGHAAVAIDYYGRTAGLDGRDDEFPFMEHAVRLNRATVQSDVSAAIDYLREGDGSRAVFTLGFCMGGRTAWLAATARRGLAGAIGLYGAPGIVGPYQEPGPTQLADAIAAPVLAIVGGADEGIPATEITAFDTALTRAGVEHDIVVYPGAPHGFFDVEHREFAGACADAWQRTLGFIARHGAHH